MLDPAPTTKIAENLARAKVLAFHDATDTKPAYAVLGFANTDYEIVVEPMCEMCDLQSRVNKKIIGTIHMQARKVTITGAGGRFVEPCSGVTRRVQGTVIGVDAEENRIIINAGVPIHLSLTAPGQHARDYSVGDFIGCDVFSHAGFAIYED